MYRTVTIQYRYLLRESNAEGGINTTIEKKNNTKVMKKAF